MRTMHAGRSRSYRRLFVAIAVSTAVVFVVGAVAAQVRTPHPSTKTHPVPFGRIIYRATKAASFESLGVTVIACRHRDPGVRRFLVEFFDAYGRKVSTFGPTLAEAPPGKKVVFVTDGRYFKNRDVWDVRLGHNTGGPARVISDAEVVRCGGKIRFDGGVGHISQWKGIGFHREGEPPPTEAPW